MCIRDRPWSALPLSNGRYAIEQHPISTIVSPRELLQKPIHNDNKQAVVFANPNYDMGINDKNKGTGAFRPLPGTATEAQAVAPHLFRLTGKTPQLIEAEAAT